MKSNPNVTLIGPGSLGSSLLEALAKSGYIIASVITRNPDLDLPDFVSGDTEVIRLNDITDKNLGRLVFIATPDDLISETGEFLSSLAVEWPERTVVHCSGFLTSGVLASIREQGGNIASFHPLQTFTKASVGEDFKNINISLEGDPQALHILENVVSDLDAQALFLDQNQKSMLHISAVFLSNYLVSLGGIADRLIQNSIPGKDVSLLHPLLLQTAANLANGTPADALTGPVARGDVKTVKEHLAMLNGDTQILQTYKLLGSEAIRIAEQKENLAGDSFRELRKLLKNEQG